MKTQLSTTLFCFLTFVCVNVPSFTIAQTWLDGAWEGIGYQTNNGHSWSIDLEVNTVTGEYSIDYPSIPCGGKWMILELTDSRARFTENITEGTYNCIPEGKVIVTFVDEEHISFTWFEPWNGEVLAFSTLQRKPKT